MNTTLIHRALALGAVILAAYAYFSEIPEPKAYYMKLAAFAMIVLAVVLRAVERKREKKN